MIIIILQKRKLFYHMHMIYTCTKLTTSASMHAVDKTDVCVQVLLLLFPAQPHHQWHACVQKGKMLCLALLKGWFCSVFSIWQTGYLGMSMPTLYTAQCGPLAQVWSLHPMVLTDRKCSSLSHLVCPGSVRSCLHLKAIMIVYISTKQLFF